MVWALEELEISFLVTTDTREMQTSILRFNLSNLRCSESELEACEQFKMPSPGRIGLGKSKMWPGFLTDDACCVVVGGLFVEILLGSAGGSAEVASGSVPLTH